MGEFSFPRLVVFCLLPHGWFLPSVPSFPSHLQLRLTTRSWKERTNPRLERNVILVGEPSSVVSFPFLPTSSKWSPLVKKERIMKRTQHTHHNNLQLKDM